jgi:hypothetical protein
METVDSIDPRKFQQLTGYDYEEIASVCGSTYDQVRRWFFSPTASNYRRPNRSARKLMIDHLQESVARAS